MNKKQHIEISFVFSLFLYYYVLSMNLGDTLIYSVFTALIAPIPDIDLTITRWFKKQKTYVRAPLYLVEELADFIFKHRTTTHTLWFASIFLISSIIFDEILYLVVFNAIVFHIVQDSMTRRGTQPLYPIDFKFKIANFSTNNKFHGKILSFFGYVLVGLFIYLL